MSRWNLDDNEFYREQRRQRREQALARAKEQFPIGTPVRADTDSGPFWGYVTGHTTNMAGGVLVLFGGARKSGRDHCAYTYELTKLTEDELRTEVADYYNW